MLDIVNNARTPIDTGGPLDVDLPGCCGGRRRDGGLVPLAVVQGDRLRITGPFPPGTTQVQFGFRFPYSGSTHDVGATLARRLRAALRRGGEGGRPAIASRAVSQQQEANAGGAPFLMATGGRLNAGDR